MERTEIELRSIEIATTLGWVKQNGVWYKNTPTGKYPAYPTYPYMDLPFLRDYEYLLEATQFLVDIGCELKINKYSVEISLIIGNEYQYRTSHQIQVIPVDYFSKDKPFKEEIRFALFVVVSNTCKFCNENNIQKTY